MAALLLAMDMALNQSCAGYGAVVRARRANTAAYNIIQYTQIGKLSGSSRKYYIMSLLDRLRAPKSSESRGARRKFHPPKITRGIFCR